MCRQGIDPKLACAKCVAVIGIASVVSFLIAVITHVNVRIRGERESEEVARMILTAQVCGAAGLLVFNFLWFQTRYNEDPEDIRVADLVGKRLKTWFWTGGPADLIVIFFTITQLLYSASGLEKSEEVNSDVERKVKFSGDITSGVFSVARLPTMLCLIFGRQRKAPQLKDLEEEEPSGGQLENGTSQRSNLSQEEQSQRTSQAQDRPSLRSGQVPIVLQALPVGETVGQPVVLQAQVVSAQVVGSPQDPIVVSATLVPSNQV
eukprot:TRINITY_DN7334_c0_g2_i1.p1 TRINITY_DN7334_c0_g2~~TRINITY_DN7334_c0_g2_i1.p1  ORF type:complete len:263 (-),score=21.35 TRINITY_DN7334_c0_g2_i1:54-842(-)